MFTKVKTSEEIANMRESGRMLAEVLAKLKAVAQPGMTGKDASELAKKELKAFGAKASFLGYSGYPDVICVSVNDEIVHGIPNDSPFKDGDIVSFDFGVNYRGMLTDAACSIVLGKATKTQKRLLKATERSMYAGIEQVKHGVKTGDIAAAVQKVLQAESLGIVRELVGHGVGHYVHEDPNIPNYGMAGTGPALKAGMTIAIEPMATLGDYRIKMDPDGWTIRTADGSLAAHFEHTVLITQDGYEILTA
ncbi:MAG TPA: type I methionyl aminopeptidase [Candidatus Saccharimonadales bacterium]|nr:type I methionyl aminopeptidase [Candidatus Saccharimonadales bacterium]